MTYSTTDRATRGGNPQGGRENMSQRLTIEDLTAMIAAEPTDTERVNNRKLVRTGKINAIVADATLIDNVTNETHAKGVKSGQNLKPLSIKTAYAELIAELGLDESVSVRLFKNNNQVVIGHPSVIWPNGLDEG